MDKQISSDMENDFDIAIIGLSARFPGAKNIDEFWQNLCSGIESVKFFTEEELKEAGIDKDILNDPDYVKAAPVLDNPGFFDASFFGYSPREAQIMDPQHRFFLESSWEALEHAGYDPDKYDGAIGVYGGASVNTYLFYSGLISHYLTDWLQINLGSDKDYLTTRVSYKLNLTGPSVTVQTACSTSLVAVHIACQSLLNYECDTALAGGASIRVPHTAGYLYQEGSIVSPDGHCRSFDAKAHGTIFGSGVGVVVLKRLADAIDDGDTIHAVIKGSAINNDGSSKVDYTAPSVNLQAEAVLGALTNSGVEPETISYVEAHGTGTALGDPIELLALTNAFHANTDKNGYCAIGSVKTNIGHLDVAAGVAGLIKTVLALKHKKIPPSLHFEKPNPKIDFDNSPFYVNTKLSEWQPQQYPRRAGVNSLGVGGTNAYAIIEEAPARETSSPSRPWQLLCVSAKSENALEKATANLAAHLKQQHNENLADVAYTLQVGRKSFGHRCVVVCKNLEDAVNNLEPKDTKRLKKTIHEPINRDVVFMFSGQGSQYVNMGLDLYNEESIFREQIDLCSEILQSQLSLDLRDVLYPDAEQEEDASYRLKQTSITQPALFAIEYALARLWMDWGINPTALIGHSIGEYVAACLAGVFSLEEALSLVAVRGRLMQELPSGSMLAVFLSEEELRPFLNKKLSLAAINGPSICTVSGAEEDIEYLEKQLLDKKLDYSTLHTSHAFHSEMMEPILDPFIEEIGRIKLNSPQIPFISNVTGTWITPEEAVTPAYWARHLRQTVRFSDGIQELLKDSDKILLEVGPGQTLCTLAKQHLIDADNHIALSSIRHPKEQKSDEEFILDSVGTLWVSGANVDWTVFYKAERRHRVPLPTYPFEWKHYWLSSAKQMQAVSYGASVTEQEQDRPDLLRQNGVDQSVDNKYDGAPRNEVEQVLTNIWQEQLGIDQVRIDDNFFDLGGTSLIAVSLFSRIKKAFAKELPLSTLYESPTIEGLAKLFKKEEKEDQWSSLVKIKAGDSRPFFLIHAAGGNVLNYRDLSSHLDKKQAIYGLQAQGLDGRQPFLQRIEDMATRYVNEIKAIQPEGPYFLGGYCLGGNIALEMAQQLQAQGQEVALLALLETFDWSKMPVMSSMDKLIFYLQKIEFHWLNFLLLDSKGKNEFFKEKFNELRRRSKLWRAMILSKLIGKNQISDEQNLLISRLWQTNDRACDEYVPKFYKGKISLFLPKKNYSIYDTPEMMFRNMAEEVEIHELPVYPAGMLVEPFVRILAEKLKSCIRKNLE